MLAGTIATLFTSASSEGGLFLIIGGPVIVFEVLIGGWLLVKGVDVTYDSTVK